MGQKIPPTVAIVSPCYNEEDVLPHTIRELSLILQMLIKKKKISRDSYILFVDDGSTDNTWKIISESGGGGELIKGIKLSKNNGHQTALVAGMEYVENKCDLLISIDADLQQDENSIEEFIDKYLSGADVVLGIRNDRNSDSFLKRVTASMFYNFMHFMGDEIVKDHADFRLLSNRANSAVLKHGEKNLFLRGLVNLIGFKTDVVFFNVKKRNYGKSKYSIGKMLSLAADGISSFSLAPLRLILAIGFLAVIVSIFMLVYVVCCKFIFPDKVVPGWASTVAPIYFVATIQFLFLGIIAEYVGKIYVETKRRPRYFIEDVKTNKGDK